MVEWDEDVAPAVVLGQTLRAVRERVGLTQKDLGRLIGNGIEVSTSTVSAWETADGRLPSPERLDAYARVAVLESIQPDESVPTAEALTVDQREEYEAVRDKLVALRDRAIRGPERTSFWEFRDDAPITIICAVLREGRSPFAEREHIYFVQALGWADLDSVIALQLEIAKRNPASEVRIMAHNDPRLVDVFTDHLVIVGGIAWNSAMTRFADVADLPVQQVHGNPGEADVFVLRDDKDVVFAPKHQGDTVLEDVGLFARYPNPERRGRTLTFCNGVYTRGVLGAALLFGSGGPGGDNTKYMLQQGVGDADSWGVLFRVESVNGAAVVPALARPGVIEHCWVNGT